VLAVTARVRENLGVSDQSRCTALLQGGARRRSVVVAGTEFCQHHGALAAKHGAEAVKRGEHLPGRRKRTVQQPVLAETAAAAARNGGSVIDPASVRPRLAAAAAENVDDLRRVLLETATGANKQLWATITRKHCERVGRYEVIVPDNKVRLDAVQALLHESFGRPGQAEPQPTPPLPSTVEQLSWEQTVLVFATHFAGEIDAVIDGGGVALRERLAGLSSDERRALRDAPLELDAA
jgi:hypothetical protein